METKRLAARIPQGRLGKSKEIAHLVEIGPQAGRTTLSSPWACWLLHCRLRWWLSWLSDCCNYLRRLIFHRCVLSCVSGKNIAMIPRSGRKAQSW
jgi:hypothetical protein